MEVVRRQFLAGAASTMMIDRVAAAPAVVEPSPIDSSVVEPVSRATVRQGERVVVPPPVAPGSSTPAPTQQPPPDTTRPYGGTPDDPLIPDDPPPGRAPSWAPAAAMVISISMVKGIPARSAANARSAIGATPIRHAAMNAQLAMPGARNLAPQAAARSEPVPSTRRPLPV